MLDDESTSTSTAPAESEDQSVPAAAAAVIDEDLPRPPSGRRSKTRPVGPPPPSPEPSAEAETAPETEPSGEAEQAADAKRATAKRASTTRTGSTRRAAAAKQAETPVTVPAPETADDAEPVEAAAEEQPAARTRATTRTRRTRKPKTEEPAEQTPPSAELEAAIEAVEASAVKRPRRATRSSAASLAGDEVPTDDTGEVDTEQVLASLAAAIANRGEAAGELPARTAPRELERATTKPPVGAETEDDDDDDLVVGEQPDLPIDTEPDADSSDDEGDDDGPATPRRRRRRGGRRRRRTSPAAGDEMAENDESVDDEQESEDDEQADQPVAEDDEPVRTTRRRRRRRRRGDDSVDSDDDAVVRVREPRRSVTDEISGIEGSTRLEAKKQRRREGRAAGRHRAPILTEAEFLARRESVERIMLVRQRDDYTQLAVLEDGVLVEHYVDRSSSTSLIGNIYLGRVQNVLPSMEAVFIDIGRGRNAVLYAGEVDWNAFDVSSDSRKVEQVFKSGQSVLVQVSKDPVGAKGARLTGHISIPGRYVVYSPGGHLSGISRKLPDAERQRLKGILDDVVADDASVIVRTAAEGATSEELTSDVERLKAQWQIIEKKSKQGSAPQQLYAEPDLTLRIIRDTFTEDFKQLIVAGHGGADDAYDQISEYVNDVAQSLSDRLVKWQANDGDPFAKFRIDEQISKALERKVFLPSGGSLVIDRTEAMTVIDVNTGKFTGSGGNLEETVTRNNLEAAEEIVRQLRLRDLGGIIVIDFIDMVLPSNRELLLRRLVECLGRDRTRHQVSEVTSLGLVQMTRKRIGTGLAEAFTDVCEHCNGRGYVRHDDPVESQAPADGGERRGGRQAGNGNGRGRQQRSTARSTRARQDDQTPKANQVQPSEEARKAAAKLAAASRQHSEQPEAAEPAESAEQPESAEPTAPAEQSEQVEVSAVPTEQAPEIGAV